jgi:hypothetical protein
MVQRITRSQWGGDNVKFDDIKKPVKDIFIHHSATKATDDAKRDMKNIESGEQARGYLTVAYLSVIHPDGSILNGRRSDDGNVHLGAATKGNNATSHAWCFIGDMRYDEPTDIALENCAQDIAQAIRDGEVDHSYVIRPHSAVVATACPGDKLRAKIVWLDARIQGILGSEAPAPSPTPTFPSWGGFPLPDGHYFGVLNKGDNKNHSGYGNGRDQSYIRMIQREVSVPDDGLFGNQTRGGVINYQKARGLVPDGLFGEKSWNAK